MPDETDTKAPIKPEVRTPPKAPPAKTIRLRTLSKHTSLPAKEIRRILKDAGVKDVDGSPYLNGNISVNIEQAFQALKIHANEPPAPTPLSAEPPNPLAEIAAQAKRTLPHPSPIGEGSGNEDEPVPQYLMEGALPDLNQSFPMPLKPRSDYVYRPILVNANRQNYMRQLGWRFVTRDDHIREIRPDGLYFGMRTPAGRIRHLDLELACMHRNIWQRRHDLLQQEQKERADTLGDTLAANIDDSRRTLRDTRGPGMDRHLQVIDMTEEEVTERKSFAKDRATGASSIKSRVFLDKND